MANHYKSLKLKLINVGYDKLDHNWNFDNVISPFSRLYLITSGEAFVYHHNKKFHLLPGHLYLIPSYVYSSYKCDVKHEQYYVSFYEELGSGLSIYNFVNFNYEVKATRLDAICFERLLAINPNRGLVNNDPKYYDNHRTMVAFEKRNIELSASNYLETHGILKVLLSKFIDANQTVEKSSNSNLDKVLSYISENLNNSLKISSLASFCSMNKDHFSRSFKNKFGIRPSNYIQNMRIERAMMLLTTSEFSLKEIALKIGYENYSHFLRAFKEQVGKTPKEFKKDYFIF